jgi:hypothetical protein
LYLARKGYDAQQYNGMADPNRPNNLYEPVIGNYGAHGDFDRLASPRSFQFWLSQRHMWLLIMTFFFAVVWYITAI